MKLDNFLSLENMKEVALAHLFLIVILTKESHNIHQ